MPVQSTVLPPGALQLGHWVSDPSAPDGQAWSGETEWKTRHGASTVHWVMGVPVRAEPVSLPDGGLADFASISSPSEAQFWRRRSPEGVGYQLGVVVIKDDGVSFSPVESRPRQVYGIGKGPDPRNDLATDADFVAAVRNRNVALAVYFAFCNQPYRKSDSETTFSLDPRGAAQFVADVRPFNEDYTDFHRATLGDMDPVDGRTAREEADRLDAWFQRVTLARLGWRRANASEIARDHAKAVKLLETSETRTPGATPEWARPYADKDSVAALIDLARSEAPMSLDQRARLAALDGRMTEEEWRSFCDLYDPDADPDRFGWRTKLTETA